MKMKQKQLTLWLLVAALVMVLAGSLVLGQTSAGFNLEWQVLGGGGGESSSADYRVVGMMGQGVASPPLADSANFVVSSGYWFNPTQTVYLPLVVR